jgi:hypothetical protein
MRFGNGGDQGMKKPELTADGAEESGPDALPRTL